MTRMSSILVFVTLTFLCWGCYGPILHHGQVTMGSGKDLWRPFILVGVAYFLVAVCVPLVLRQFSEEPGQWTFSGVAWSLVAGVVGALGALGVLLAFSSGGRPIFVMPLVFGCAPVVNTLFTMLTTKTARRARLPFYLGIVLVALGAFGVLRFKPSAGPKQAAAQVRIHVQGETPELEGARRQGDWLIATGESVAAVTRELLPKLLVAEGVDILGIESGAATPILAVFYIVVTALCWGTYGPLLHRGQAGMGGSRFRPFICVGVAYFIVAIVVPTIILIQSGDEGSFTMQGSMWSLGAGILGAVGALGVILAFNSGGRPVFVMPLIFGGAPVINTLVSMLESRLEQGEVGTLTSYFLISMALVIIGAVMVLVFVPKAGHSPPQQDAPRRDGSGEPAGEMLQAAD